MTPTPQKLCVLTVLECPAPGNYDEPAASAVAVCTTRGKAFAALARWCRGEWAALRDGEPPLPADDVEAVNAYFNHFTDDDYEITELTVDEGV